MYKDFKKTESLDRGLVGGNGLAWMFSGVVLGLLFGLGMYHFSKNPESNIDTVQKRIERAQLEKVKRAPVPLKKTALAKASKTNKAQKEERKTVYSYYAVLPSIDVPVDINKPVKTEAILSQLEAIPLSRNVATKKEKLIAKSNTVSTGDYLVQVASFRKKKKADLTMTLLSKRGVNAYIQEKKVKGSLWYRVVAGPVNKTNANLWKQTAEKLGHEPFIFSNR